MYDLAPADVRSTGAGIKGLYYIWAGPAIYDMLFRTVMPYMYIKRYNLVGCLKYLLTRYLYLYKKHVFSLGYRRRNS